MDLDWDQLKSYISNKPHSRKHFVDLDHCYVIEVMNGDFKVTCKVDKETLDADDLVENYFELFNKDLSIKVDEDNAQVVNPKLAGAERTYQSLHFQMTLGASTDFQCKDYLLNDFTFLSVMHYKSEDELLTEFDTDSDIVKTVVILSPTFDYDIQGFCLYQKTQPEAQIKMWGVMLPFIPEAFGSPKELISGIDLSISPYGIGFMDYVGDSATTINNFGPGSNEMMLIFRFPTSTNHKIMGELFWYV